MIDLVSENDPILKQTVPEYDFENLPTFLNDKSFGLKEFIDLMMISLQINKGLGLAAPQIGQSIRLFVMKIGDEEFECINPVIKEQSNNIVSDKEGCLSFPELSLIIKRPAEIFVTYQTIEGIVIQRWFNGKAARCFQHELDHLNGITFDMKVGKVSLQLAKQRRLKIIKQRQRKK